MEMDMDVHWLNRITVSWDIKYIIVCVHVSVSVCVSVREWVSQCVCVCVSTHKITPFNTQ